MGKCTVALWACVWGCVLSLASGVRLENGRYEDLVVALDPLMEFDTLDLTKLPAQFTAMINDMSEAMLTATKERLSVGSVRVVLPHWWNNTDVLTLQPAEEAFSWHRADMRMEKPLQDPLTGVYLTHAPYTLQVGQCGVPGRHITIHITLLDDGYSEDNYGARGFVLMHEWAHYRWGIFDEYGHPEDPKYPVSYEDEGERHVSACYAGELYGEYLTKRQTACPGDPNDSSNPCYFFPNATSIPATTMSSLMSHTFLSDGQFCNNVTHNPSAPTPQNVMCGGRSVWEVLAAHPDFQQQGGTLAAPTITFHKAPMTRVFFLFDEPPKDAVEDLRSSVHEFIEYYTKLYRTVEVGMATFSSAEDGTVVIYNDLDFTPITNFSSIENFLPDNSLNDSSLETHLGQALLDLLPEWEPYEPGTMVVAIVYEALSEIITEDLITQLLDVGAKLLVVSPFGDLQDILPIIPTLQNTGGQFYFQDQFALNASGSLPKDLGRYLDSYKIDDHRLYGVTYQEVEPKTSARLPEGITEIRGLAEQINGYLRIAPFNDPDLIDITLIVTDGITSSSLICNDNDNSNSNKLNCEYAPDGIFFYAYTPTSYTMVREYFLEIENKGNEAVTVNGTWSVVDDNPKNPHLAVEVWASEAAGVKADIEEADSLFLYCQVTSTYGVVQNVEVRAEVEFVYGGTTTTQVITLSDAGDGAVDVKAKDTVWSGRLAGSWSPGTTVTVSTLAVNHNPDVFSPLSHHGSSSRLSKLSSGGDASGWQEAGGSSGSSSSSSGRRVLPIDPRDADTLSTSSSSTVLGSQYVFNQMLRRPYTFMISSDLTNPPPPVNVIGDPATPPYVANDTVKVTIIFSKSETSRKTDSVMYEYWARYHPDEETLLGDFLSAEMPLDGAVAPADATSMVVTLPLNDTLDVFVAVAAVDLFSGVPGQPSTPIEVEMTQFTTTPSATTTTTPTTPTTTTITTTTTTTPAPPTTPPASSSTSTTSTTSTTTNKPPADDDGNDNTVTIVVSVVCAVVAVGIAGGLFYYFKYYRTKTA